MRDTALIIFTILTQLAVGSFITLWLYDRRRKNEVSQNTGFLVTMLILIITGASLVVSLFHLGQPLHAYKAILNVGESWLSREIILFALFFGAVVISTFAWKDDNPKSRNTIGLIGSIIGLAGIFSQGMIYIVPAVPAWNSIFTLVFFYITAALLGPLFVGTILVSKKELNVDFSKISLATIVIAIVALGVYLSTLFAGLEQAVFTANLIFFSSLFWIRVALLIVPLVLLGFAIRRQSVNMTTYSLLFVLLITSEVIGRTLYYTTAIQL